MAGIGHKLLLLGPCRFHRAHGPPRQQDAYQKECGKCSAAQQQAGAEQPGQSLRFVGCISEYDKVPAVRFQPQKPQVRICQHAALCVAVHSFLRRLLQKFSIGQIIVAAACRFDRAILGH